MFLPQVYITTDFLVLCLFSVIPYLFVLNKELKVIGLNVTIDWKVSQSRLLTSMRNV